MGLLTGVERTRALLCREDYNIQPMMLPVEEYASDVITKKKNQKRDKSWLLVHQLLKRCYNIPGIPDGAKALLISPRDVVFDPLKQLDDSWSKEKIKVKMGEIAREQYHKADARKVGGAMNTTVLLMGIAAFILFLCIGIIMVAKYYTGMVS